MEIVRNGGNGRRSLSVEHNGVLYTSGLTSTDLQADITQQTKDVMETLEKILSRHHITKNNILTATITLAHIADYGDFNAVWDEWIVDGFEPARSVTQGDLAIPEYKVKIAITAAL